jgi:hypothetical protein
MQREKRLQKLTNCMRKGIVYNKNQYDNIDAVGIIKKLCIKRRDQKSQKEKMFRSLNRLFSDKYSQISYCKEIFVSVNTYLLLND